MKMIKNIKILNFFYEKVLTFLFVINIMLIREAENCF